MLKNLMMIIVLLTFAAGLFAAGAEYSIVLEWDIMSGELNGILSGNLDGQNAFVQGVAKSVALGFAIVSLGEQYYGGGEQRFEINRREGYYSFWIRDKFADDDVNPDLRLIRLAKPVISVYQGVRLMQRFEIDKGLGLTCKVFTLDAANATLDGEIRFFPRTRIFMVMVVDAVSGAGISGADLHISGGEDRYPSVQTDESGIAFIPVEIGSYRLDIVKAGYINTSVNAVMGFDENPREFVFAIAPKAKEFRIVLTWGSRPHDLDAHLSGPHPDSGRFHLWYRNRVLIAGRDFLDRDDMDGYGPETVTIYKPAAGEYAYHVHDFSNRLDRTSNYLSRSGAIVQVYGDEKLQASFSIPSEQFGNLWAVFKIDKNQQIIPLNKISWIENESNIR
ncbi:MAG: hypothetical protein Q8M98_04415 [Candidatus Cloacimonadaceae bacterium]|nr:hypothetical protein [Candidatus Cloacimonadaceae bacterium]MDP3114003.1 hypothetical protein [Candidatus Cloacimonadaceae bacterium]